jgi:hypothetical protein
VKVKDLVKALNQMDSELEVICVCKRNNKSGQSELALCEVDGATMKHVKLERDETGADSASFGKGKDAVPMALIKITTNF